MQLGGVRDSEAESQIHRTWRLTVSDFAEQADRVRLRIGELSPTDVRGSRCVLETVQVQYALRVGCVATAIEMPGSRSF